MTTLHTFLILSLLTTVTTVFAEPAARISLIQGSATILRNNQDEWRPARLNQPLAVGDQVYCRTESFVEIRYAVGAVLRMNEETKITLETLNDGNVATANQLGEIWVNMKKIAGSGNRKFDLSSPTAVASIRGTAFSMNTGRDSSTSVSVFDGAVAVGPSDRLKQEQSRKQPSSSAGAQEVPGPEEVPGPFEVSLETWRTIVAGQRISVRSDGTFSEEPFDLNDAFEDGFAEKNRELDKAFENE